MSFADVDIVTQNLISCMTDVLFSLSLYLYTATRAQTKNEFVLRVYTRCVCGYTRSVIAESVFRRLTDWANNGRLIVQDLVLVYYRRIRICDIASLSGVGVSASAFAQASRNVSRFSAKYDPKQGLISSNLAADYFQQ